MKQAAVPQLPGVSAPTAIVIGAGLAGISAAVRLTEMGWQVTLMEARKKLGGRATSYIDPRTGQRLDNCQHVILRCCTNMIDLLRRLGVEDQIDWHDEMHFLTEGGRDDVFRRSGLPAPAHLMPSLLRCRFLSWKSKVAIMRAMLAIRRGDQGCDNLSFAAWLRRHRQPAEAVEWFWSVVVVSAMNETIEATSAEAAIKVFRDGFLGHATAYEIGVPRVPLVQLYQRTDALLRRRQGCVVTSTPVNGFDLRNGQVDSVFAGGQALRADAYVIAVSLDRLAKLLPAGIATIDDRFASLQRFEFSPILGIHLWFNSRVLLFPHAVFIGSPLHWIFDRGVQEEGRQHLHAVVSAAREWIELPPQTIVKHAVGEIHRYLPASRSAQLVRGEVIKERQATFSPAPGVAAIRPSAAGAIENLFLCGDFCRTGWPATMEGAVRSGYLAATAITGKSMLAPPLGAE